jgi:hypothetical protein
MVETTGKQLKSKLGLSHMKYVEISRVLISTYKVYLVFYDSRRPNFPITTQRALKSGHIAMLYQYPFEDSPTVLPLMHLDDFNGPLHPAMFFVVDMAGDKGDSKNKVDLKRESVPRFYGNLNEFMTLSNLKSADSASAFTQRTRKQRNQAVGTENKTSKLVDLSIDTVEDHVTFVFKTTATTPIYAPSAEFGKVDPNDLQIKKNPDKSYELYVRILDFFEWLDAQQIDDRTLTSKDIKEILEVSNVQLFSTSPSFQYQSMNFNMSQVDASIYPTNIAPKVWDSPHLHGENAFLDKHLYGLINQIGFFANPMASMLTKRLKDRGLL